MEKEVPPCKRRRSEEGDGGKPEKKAKCHSMPYFIGALTFCGAIHHPFLAECCPQHKVSVKSTNMAHVGHTNEHVKSLTHHAMPHVTQWG